MFRPVGKPVVVGAMLLVAGIACSSGQAVQTSGDGAAAATEVAAVPATAFPLTSVPVTTAAADPLPSPTALTFVEPTPAPPFGSQATSEQATPQPEAAVQAAPAPVTQVPVATAAPPADSQQILVANGGEVYTLNCARCHGENGLGTQQYSAGLVGVGSQYSNAGMIAELTNGHPVTFGFADRLSADEIASVVAYVKSVFP